MYSPEYRTPKPPEKSDLFVCDECNSGLVQMVGDLSWAGGIAADAKWLAVLRCPECEHKTTKKIPDSERAAVNLQRKISREAIWHSVVTLAELNGQEAIDQLHEALETDLLLPEDF